MNRAQDLNRAEDWQVPPVENHNNQPLLAEPFRLTTHFFVTNGATSWTDHSHLEHELLWAEHGSVQVRTQSRAWRLSPGLALLIPSGTVHRVASDATAALGATHINPHFFSQSWETPTLMSVAPALRELLLHENQNDMPQDHRARAQQVCLDLLQPASSRRTEVPVPSDPRVVPLVEKVLAQPHDSRSLEQWAIVLKVSPRTITRIFSAETQMSFVQWRIAVRMEEAVAQLMNGRAVQQVSRHLGYASVSTFVATFRRIMGVTPGAVAEGREPAAMSLSG